MKKIFSILPILFLLCAFQNVSAQKKSATQKKVNPAIIICGACNQKAIYVPKPEYPKTALAVSASGKVTVEILVDKKGNVIEANAVSGHPFLLGVSVKAALKTKFTPVTLSGIPIKVRGVIVYNFQPN